MSSIDDSTTPRPYAVRLGPAPLTWTAADQAQLDALVARKEAVMSAERRTLEAVCEKFTLCSLCAMELPVNAAEHADELIAALKPFAKEAR